MRKQSGYQGGQGGAGDSPVLSGRRIACPTPCLVALIGPPGSVHVYRPVYRAAEDALARAALHAGHTVIVDRTNRTRTRRRVPRSRWS